MRVTTGTARGTRLRVPSSLAIRPTADRTKGAIFSMLESLLLWGRPDADVGTPELWEGLRALDLFAGSGGLGIEALSRGAAHAIFVESDRDAVGAIRTNLDATRLADRAAVVAADVFGSLDRLPGPFDLVLLDPPYAEPRTLELLERIESRPWLAEDAVVLLEHGERLVPPGTLRSLSIQRARRHGDTSLALYARGRFDRERETRGGALEAG